MVEQKVISICIPTYNRGKLLGETMKNICEEYESLPQYYKNKVELCISDNASVDNTSDLVKSFAKKSSIDIKFNVNPQNIGLDRNFLKAVDLASGQYIWFLGSDDKIRIGGLRFVMEFLIINKEIDILVMNSLEMGGNNNVPTLLIAEQLNERILYYKGHFESALNVIEFLGYMSILCFRKTLWNGIDKYEQFVGTQYIHVFKLLSMIRDGAKVANILEPRIILYRANNDSVLKEHGLMKRMVFTLESFYIIPSAVFGRNTKEHKKLSLRIIKHDFPSLYLAISSIRMNIRDRGTLIKNFLKYYWRYPILYLKILPPLLMPFGSNGKFLFSVDFEKVISKMKKNE